MSYQIKSGDEAKKVQRACGRSAEGHHWVRGPRGSWGAGWRKGLSHGQRRTADGRWRQQIIHAESMCAKCGKKEIRATAASGKQYVVRR